MILPKYTTNIYDSFQIGYRFSVIREIEYTNNAYTSTSS